MDKRFTQAQVDLALRKEQLIQRVEQGESVEAVSQDLGLTYHPKHVSRLRRRYIEGGRHWVSLVDGREGGQATKITTAIAQWIVEELQRDLGATAASVRDQIQRVFHLAVSDRRIRQLIRDLRERPRGRPRPTSPLGEISREPLIIEQTQHAGIFFPARGPLADGDPGRPDAGVGKVRSPIPPARCTA